MQGNQSINLENGDIMRPDKTANTDQTTKMGVQLMIATITSKVLQCLCLVFFPLLDLCVSRAAVSPKSGHLIAASPTTSHQHLTSS